MFDLANILRPNVRQLSPYSTARDEFKGTAQVYLDANENPYGSIVGQGLNRYPDPLQYQLKEYIAQLKGVRASQIFLGNGSDEAIDLIFRAFCNPGQDNVLILPPTYGMYQVSAQINEVALRRVLLRPDFSLDTEQILAQADARSKVVFVCSPNNPTGNQMAQAEIEALLQGFHGLVIVDEAYIDYAEGPSLIGLLDRYPNLIVSQTFSKAWGLAALRLGVSYASEAIVEVLNKIKPPYNINELTKRMALEALQKQPEVEAQVAQTKAERKRLAVELRRFGFVQHVFPSDANFVLVRVDDARALYNYLLGQGIVVRDRSTQPLCEGTIRITIGTPKENSILLASLKTFEKTTPKV